MQEFFINNKEIIITDSPQELADIAVSFMVQKLKAASLLPSFNVLLDTDPSLDKVYARLAKADQRGETSFHKISAFQTDEFFTNGNNTLAMNNAATHGSQSEFMNQALFSEIDIKKQNIIYPGLENIKTPGSYDQFIQSKGGINICLCTLGVNGRLALNEPGTPKETLTRQIKLKDNTREEYKTLFSRTIVPDAISVGVRTILNAQEIIFVATGKEKIDIVARLFKEQPSPSLPATFIKEHPRVRYIIDKYAAKKIQSLAAFEE